MTPKVDTLKAGDEPRWDRFVTSVSGATFFHLSGWRRVIEQACGHRMYYLYAHSEGTIRAVLPMGHIKSRLFGNALISNPFCVYGGIASLDSEAQAALENAACHLAEDLGVDYLEFRNQRPTCEQWPKKDLYVTFRKEIAPEVEANLRAIPRKQRAMVRKGEKARLQAEPEGSVERFFAAYSESVRNLGTPVLSKRYFALLKEVFGDACRVLTVTLDGELVSSVMSFYFRDEVLPYYGGGTSRARSLYANDFMYWELMRRSCGEGIRIFDYGRSKVGTGSYNFKKNWGFTPRPLSYEYHLVRSPRVPDLSPLNPKYRLFINVWKRLPLRLSQRIGPWVAPYLA